MAAIKGNSKERRNEILRFLKEAGTFNPPVKQLAEKYGVSESMIYLDIEYLMKNIPNPIIAKLSKRFIISYEKVLAEGHKLLLSNDSKEKAIGAQIILQAARDYTDFLEKYGYKTKIPDVQIIKQVSMGKLVIEGGTNAVRRILESDDTQVE